MEPVCSGKGDLQHYSLSRWLLSYWSFPKKLPVRTTTRGHSPIDDFRVGTVERWNSTSQIMEWPGTMKPAALWIALLMLHTVSALILLPMVRSLSQFWILCEMVLLSTVSKSYDYYKSCIKGFVCNSTSVHFFPCQEIPTRQDMVFPGYGSRTAIWIMFWGQRKQIDQSFNGGRRRYWNK